MAFRYYWERRNVVKRTAMNLLHWSVAEPFRHRGSQGENVVIFVCQNARARTFNIAFPLKSKVRTILFSKVFEYKYQSKAFDEIHFYLNYSDLEKKINRLAKRYKIVAAIGATEPIKQTCSLVTMNRDWPVLVDQFDSYWSSVHFAGLDLATDKHFGHLKQEVDDEKFCFKQADGVIARSGELKLLFKEVGVSTPVLLFEDGCNSIYFQPVGTLTAPRKREWSVVYPGLIYPMSMDPKRYGSAQFVPVGKLFAAEGVHLHLYPGPIHDYQLPEYHAEAAENKYFHIHPSVDFDKVQREVSQYDFGWYAVDSKSYGLSSDVYREFAVSTKFCTYLEAGIPVISNGLHKRSVDIIRETGCGIIVGEESPRGLRRAIEGADIEALRLGVAKARDAMDVCPRGTELWNFIHEVKNRYNKSK